MKKRVLRLILCSALPFVSTSYANTSYRTTPDITQTAEQNKKIVIDFYQGVFQKHEVKRYSDQYIGAVYTQHNPYVADGKAPFVDYFTQYFKTNPKANSEIKRAIADNDLVWLHVHSKAHENDLGTAVVDIFRVKDGKIVEHWDVIQDVPAESANKNSMF